MNGLIETAAPHSTQVEAVVQSLKQAYDAKDYEQQLKGYQALGEIYLIQRADPINAIALYNFALAICQDEQKNMTFAQSVGQCQALLVEKIKEAERQFLFSITGKTLPASDYRIDQVNKEYLTTIREEARAKLMQHSTLVEMINQNLPSDLERLEKIKRREAVLVKRNLSIHQIYQQISEQLRGYVRLLIDECKQVLGQPPCDYAITCFGSLARDEATPYSDLEFGVLLAEGKDTEENKFYFRNLTKLLNIKMINLGETTPRMQDIIELREAGLAGRYSESSNRPGFSFDGNNKEGRKTPLGNKQFSDIDEKERYELILAPKQMAQLHNEEWYQKDKHLSTVLITAKLLDGNELLYEAYEQETAAVLSVEVVDVNNDDAIQSSENHELSKKTLIQARSLKLLQESLESYRFRGGRFEEEGHFFDAKYHLYRLPNMLISHLASYFNINEKSLWDRIQILFNTKEEANVSAVINLKDIVSTILRLRLMAYIRADCRDNLIIPLDLKNPKNNQELFIKHLSVNNELFFQIYAVLIPLQRAVESFIEKDSQKHILLKDNYYDDSHFVRGSICELMLDYSNAANEYEKAKQFFIDMHDNISVADTLNSLGNVYWHQKRYEDTIAAYEKAMKIYMDIRDHKNISVGATLTNLANVYTEYGHYEKSIESLEKAKKCTVTPLLLNGILNNLGNVYSKRKQFKEAITAYKEARKIYKITYGNKDPTYLTNMGNIYAFQGRYNEAILSYKKAKKIKVAEHGNMHISIADILNSKGYVYYHQAYYNKAIEKHKKSLEIARRVYKEKHILVARIFNNLGNVYVEEKQFEQARKYYSDAVEIYKDLQYPNKQKATNNLLAHSYIREGNIYLLKDKVDIEAAKKCYQRSDLFADSDPNPIQFKTQQALINDAYNSGSLHAACEHLKILIKFYPHNASAYHNLARLIHVYAKIEQDKMEVESCLTYLGLADDYFQQSITLHAHVGIYTEYAQFMLRNHSYYSLDNVIWYLDKALRLNQSDQYLSYRVMERITVDSILQNLIDKYNVIIFNAQHLAYYLLIQAHLTNSQLVEAEQTLLTFEEKIVNLQGKYQKEQIELLEQAKANFQAQSGQAELTRQKVLQIQQVSKKEQQLAEELLEIARQTIASYKLPSLQPVNNNKKNDNNLELEMRFPQTRSTASQASDLPMAKNSIRVSELFKQSLLTKVSEIHNQLLKRLDAVVEGKHQNFQLFFHAIDERAYAKALRRACTSGGEMILKLVSVLLEYKEALSININERAGNKQFAAIHYAAQKNNQVLYDLLVQHGADKELLYDSNVTVREYMCQQQNLFRNSLS